MKQLIQALGGVLTQSGKSVSEMVSELKLKKNEKAFEGKIDVGGFSLYLNSLGKHKPVVIFDSGYGDTSDVWIDVQKAIAPVAQAVRYDRAGLGQSDPSLNRRVSKNMAMELHTLLQNAGIKGPYILVGHSFGSINVREFASLYPNEVAGLVLVDGTSEKMLTEIVDKLPADFQEMFYSQFNTSDGSSDDVRISLDQVLEARDAIHNIPLTVLVSTHHGVSDDIEQMLLALQNEVASLSILSKEVISPIGGHYVQLENPSLVINAIEEMINVVKHNHANEDELKHQEALVQGS